MKLSTLIALLEQAQQKIGHGDIEVSVAASGRYASDLTEVEDVEVEVRVVQTVTYVNGQPDTESQEDKSKVTVVVG
jgi:hypothetical protein